MTSESKHSLFISIHWSQDFFFYDSIITTLEILQNCNFSEFEIYPTVQQDIMQTMTPKNMTCN